MSQTNIEVIAETVPIQSKPPLKRRDKNYSKEYYLKNKEKATDNAKKLYYINKFKFDKELCDTLSGDELLILGNAKLYLEQAVNNENVRKQMKTHIYPLILV